MEGREVRVDLGDGRSVRGVVVRVATGRAYVTFFSPPVAHERGAAWNAWFGTSFVVDDVALRDGGWQLGPPAPALYQRALDDGEPQMQFRVETTAGGRRFACYDPATLRFIGEAPVADERAWHRANLFVPPDTTTTDLAVRTTFLERDLGMPEPRRRDELNALRSDLATLRDSLADRDEPRRFAHLLCFPGPALAAAAAAELRASGFTVHGLGPHELAVINLAAPAWPAIEDLAVHLLDLAASYGATYDGFVPAVVPSVANDRE